MSLLLDGLRVLLLEDEVLIAMDVEQLCHDNGAAEVTVVRALEEIDMTAVAHSVDVVIVDLSLNGASTLDFAHGLKEAGTPFVFASAYSDNEEIEAAFPGIAFVGKPYSGSDLIEAVAAASRTLSTARTLPSA